MTYRRTPDRLVPEQERQRRAGSADEAPLPRHGHAPPEAAPEVRPSESTLGAIADIRTTTGKRPKELYDLLQALLLQGIILHADDLSWMKHFESRMCGLLALSSSPRSPTGSLLQLSVATSAATSSSALPLLSKAIPKKHEQDHDAERKRLNQALYQACAASVSCHDERRQRFEKLDQRVREGLATKKEAQWRNGLAALIQRDAKHQVGIDIQLSAAVEARCQLVQQIRAGRQPDQLPKKFIETKKGCFLVTPIGIDPFDLDEIAKWLHVGFRQKQAAVKSPVVDFQISWSDGAQHDREWMRYVVRRICRVIGRDPDHHVFAAAHEPDRHGPSKVDGKPVQPHAHIAVLTCNPDGIIWRCQNIHLVIQRELESINRERGWNRLTTASVAKGRQPYWYTKEGSARIGWSTISSQGRTFTPSDCAVALADLAREPVPNEGWRRPGAGIIVFNAQDSERRLALRRKDQARFSATQAQIEMIMAEQGKVDHHRHIDEHGRILLRYFSGSAQPGDDLNSRLVRAVMQRDQAGTALLAHRILYFFE